MFPLGMLKLDPIKVAHLPRLESHVDKTVIPSAPALWMDYDPDGYRYPLDNNGVLGDCVVAWIYHAIESAWRRRFFQVHVPNMATDVVGTSEQATAWYWAEVARQGGGTNETPPGPGLDPVQAALDWGTQGVPTNLLNIEGATQTILSTETNKNEGVLSVGLTNLAFLRWAAYNFAGLGLAVSLPYDYAQVAASGKPWGNSGPADPDNGHMVLISGYSVKTGLWQIESWGQAFQVTAAWIAAYAQLALVTLDSDWTSIPGMDSASLLAELQSLGGQPATDSADHGRLPGVLPAGQA